MPDTETITVDATSTTTDATPKPDATTKDEPLGEAGKLALMKERETREAAEKRAKAAEAELAKINAAKTTADEETAKRNGEFERLYQAEIAKRETAERDLEAERRALIRSRIAAKHRVPPKRLIGETEEELEADAKELAKEMASREAPDTEAGSGSGTRRPAISDRPIRKELDESNRQTQTHTFNGQRKVAWPT